jgi:hypothetical protein
MNLPERPKEVEELPEKPTVRRICTNDSTIEKLADLMVNSPGQTLKRDELAAFLLNMSRYSKGSDRQFYLECYSGGSFSVDRMIRGNQLIDDLYLNIIGGIQPQVAKKLFAIEGGPNEGYDDGLLERFGVIAFPEKLNGYQHVDRWPNRAMKELFNGMCDKLASANWEELLYADDFGSKPFTRFDREAQEIFDEWLIDHMREGLPMSDDDPLAGMLGKARGLLVRLTLVIHLAAWAAGEHANPRDINTTSLTRALKLLEDYLLPTWRRVFAAFGKTAADDGAHRIAKWIKAERRTEVRFRDIRLKHWKGLSEDREIQAAINMLIAHRWLGDPIQKPTRGRPSTIYPVNPLVHKRENHV